MTPDKIRPHHLERKAILYVRQSSAHQVLHNRESSRCNTRCEIVLWRSVGHRSKRSMIKEIEEREEGQRCRDESARHHG
jgi:hypothetical protein